MLWCLVAVPIPTDLPPPADGILLHVIGFIKGIEDGARAAPAYTATLRVFGLGKERPMAPRILVWCSSGVIVVALLPVVPKA